MADLKVVEYILPDGMKVPCRYLTYHPENDMVWQAHARVESVNMVLEKRVDDLSKAETVDAIEKASEIVVGVRACRNVKFRLFLKEYLKDALKPEDIEKAVNQCGDNEQRDILFLADTSTTYWQRWIQSVTNNNPVTLMENLLELLDVTQAGKDYLKDIARRLSPRLTSESTPKSEP